MEFPHGDSGVTKVGVTSWWCHLWRPFSVIVLKSNDLFSSHLPIFSHHPTNYRHH